MRKILISSLMILIAIPVLAQNHVDYKTPTKLDVEDFQTLEDRNFLDNFDLIKIPTWVRKMLKTEEKYIASWLREQTADVYDYQQTIQIMRQGVLATDKQFAWIKKVADDCAEILHLSPTPSVFIVGNDTLMADVVNFKQPFIIVSSNLVEKSNPEALRFIIGQQMGHIKCDHVFYFTLFSGELNSVGAILGKWVQELIKSFVGKVIALTKVDWVLASEISADRAGLIACQNLDVAQRALLNLKLDIPIDQVELNLEDYLEQYKIVKEKEAIILDRFPQSVQKGLNHWRLAGQLKLNHPFLFQRLKALQEYAESTAYQKLFE